MGLHLILRWVSLPLWNRIVGGFESAEAGCRGMLHLLDDVKGSLTKRPETVRWRVGPDTHNTGVVSMRRSVEMLRASFAMIIQETCADLILDMIHQRLSLLPLEYPKH
jgi:hypothetical protein